MDSNPVVAAGPDTGLVGDETVNPEVRNSTEEDLDGIDPDDPLHATERKPKKLFGFDWNKGFVAPFVPTPTETADAMMNRAEVAHGTIVLDLGSGEGELVLAAARNGAFAVGYELDEELNETARRRAIELGLSSRISFVKRDVMEVDAVDSMVEWRQHFMNVDSDGGSGSSRGVVVMYMLPEVLGRLEDKAKMWIDSGIPVMTVRWPFPNLRPKNEGADEGFWHYV